MRRPLPPPIRLFRIRIKSIMHTCCLTVSIFHSRFDQAFKIVSPTSLDTSLSWTDLNRVSWAGWIQCRVVIKWRWCRGRMVGCTWVQFLPFPCQIWWWALEGDPPFRVLRPKAATQAFQTIMMFRRAVAVIDAPPSTAAGALFVLNFDNFHSAWNLRFLVAQLCLLPCYGAASSQGACHSGTVTSSASKYNLGDALPTISIVTDVALWWWWRCCCD